MINEVETLKEILTAINGYSSNELSGGRTFGWLSIEDKIDVLRKAIREMALIQLQELQEKYEK
jgi:hypothetical protein